MEKCVWKRSNWGNFPRSPKNLTEIVGKSETEGNATLPQRGWTPLSNVYVEIPFVSLKSLNSRNTSSRKGHVTPLWFVVAGVLGNGYAWVMTCLQERKCSLSVIESILNGRSVTIEGYVFSYTFYPTEYLPDDGCSEKISVVGERRDGWLSHQQIRQDDRGKAHQHARQPTRQRVSPRKCWRLYERDWNTMTTEYSNNNDTNNNDDDGDHDDRRCSQRMFKMCNYYADDDKDYDNYQWWMWLCWWAMLGWT